MRHVNQNGSVVWTTAAFDNVGVSFPTASVDDLILAVERNETKGYSYGLYRNCNGLSISFLILWVKKLVEKVLNLSFVYFH